MRTTARYSCPCAVCQQAIEPGDEIDFERGVGVMCARCADGRVPAEALVVEEVPAEEAPAEFTIPDLDALPEFSDLKAQGIAAAVEEALGYGEGHRAETIGTCVAEVERLTGVTICFTGVETYEEALDLVLAARDEARARSVRAAVAVLPTPLTELAKKRVLPAGPSYIKYPATFAVPSDPLKGLDTDATENPPEVAEGSETGAQGGETEESGDSWADEVNDLWS